MLLLMEHKELAPKQRALLAPIHLEAFFVPTIPRELASQRATSFSTELTTKLKAYNLSILFAAVTTTGLDRFLSGLLQTRPPRLGQRNDAFGSKQSLGETLGRETLATDVTGVFDLAVSRFVAKHMANGVATSLPLKSLDDAFATTASLGQHGDASTSPLQAEAILFLKATLQRSLLDLESTLALGRKGWNLKRPTRNGKAL